jgi:hypothetical protein
MLGPTTGTTITQTIYNATATDIKRGQVVVRAAQSGAYYKDFQSETKDFGTGTASYQFSLLARRHSSGEADKAEVLGVAAEDIKAGTFGLVVVFGCTYAYVEDQATPIPAGSSLVSGGNAGSFDDDSSTNVKALLLEVGETGAGSTATLKRVFVNALDVVGALTA